MLTVVAARGTGWISFTRAGVTVQQKIKGENWDKSSLCAVLSGWKWGQEMSEPCLAWDWLCHGGHCGDRLPALLASIIALPVLLICLLNNKRYLGKKSHLL